MGVIPLSRERFNEAVTLYSLNGCSFVTFQTIILAYLVIGRLVHHRERDRISGFRDGITDT